MKLLNSNLEETAYMFTLKISRRFTIEVDSVGATVRLPLIGEWFIDPRWRVTFSPWRELIRFGSV